MSEEVKGLPQPPDRHRAPRPPLSGAKRRRLENAKTVRAGGRVRANQPGVARPKRRRGRRGARAPSPPAYRKVRSRGSSKFARGLLRKILRMLLKGGRTSDFRNHGFKGSGRGYRTGFAGMKPRRAW